jgi:hypothetical protein
MDSADAHTAFADPALQQRADTHREWPIGIG